jgi:hypothetical protein
VLTVSGRTPNALGLKYFASDSSTSIRSSDWNRLLTERESIPVDVVDKVNRDFPRMKKWYPNSIFRALDPRMLDAELEKLKGELSYRCRRILLEHPEYRERSRENWTNPSSEPHPSGTQSHVSRRSSCSSGRSLSRA